MEKVKCSSATCNFLPTSGLRLHHTLRKNLSAMWKCFSWKKQGKDDWLTGNYMCDSERRQNSLYLSTVPLVFALLKNRIREENNLWKIFQKTTSATYSSHMNVPVNYCIMNCDRVNWEEISTGYSS